jgi:gliding motility-associated-like protein
MFRRVLILVIIVLSSYYCFSQGILPPQYIDYVTVDFNTGNVTIKWEPSASIDASGYNIYVLRGQYWIYIGSVNVPTTTFLHTTAHPQYPCLANSQPESYRVATFDGASPPNLSQMCDSHTTIYMTLNFEDCHARTRIYWTPYLLWTSGVFEYQVYYKINAGAWSVLALVPGDQISFVHANLVPDVNYQYYIKATDGSHTKTSTSNKKSITSTMPHPPTIFNADYCTVTGENRVELSFTIDPAANVKKYKIIRSDTTKMHYDTIAIFNSSAITGNKIKYTDYFDINNDILYYRLVAVNTCDVDITVSNIASNILLTVIADEDMTNTLIWNNYKDWYGNISEYRLYRVNDNDTALVTTVSYGDTIYIDNLENYIYHFGNPTPVENPYNLQPRLSGHFCYYIKAYEGNDNPFGIKASSKSNTTCSGQMTRLFVPTAFTPNSDGYNDKFYPFITFASVTDYLFIVYNRWGEIVFQTTDTRGYWDGKKGSEPAPAGGYIYYIRYKSADDKVSERTGFFVLYY